MAKGWQWWWTVDGGRWAATGGGKGRQPCEGLHHLQRGRPRRQGGARLAASHTRCRRLLLSGGGDGGGAADAEERLDAAILRRLLLLALQPPAAPDSDPCGRHFRGAEADAGLELRARTDQHFDRRDRPQRRGDVKGRGLIIAGSFTIHQRIRCK